MKNEQDVVRRAMSHDEFERRRQAARNRAEWELGDASWAGVILAAFLSPDADAAALKAEKAQD